MGHQEVSGDTNPADTLISELQPPELTVENSLLWEAACGPVTAALEHCT